MCGFNELKLKGSWLQTDSIKKNFRRITIWLIPIKEIPTTTAHMLISQNKLDTTHLQN